MITNEQVKTWIFARFPELVTSEPVLLLSLDSFISDNIISYCEKQYRDQTLKIVGLNSAHDYYFNNTDAIIADGGGSPGGSGSGNSGPVTKRKEGDIELTFASLSGSTSKQDSYLSQTKYGQALERALNQFSPISFPIVIT